MTPRFQIDRRDEGGSYFRMRALGLGPELVERAIAEDILEGVEPSTCHHHAIVIRPEGITLERVDELVAFFRNANVHRLAGRIRGAVKRGHVVVYTDAEGATRVATKPLAQVLRVFRPTLEGPSVTSILAQAATSPARASESTQSSALSSKGQP